MAVLKNSGAVSIYVSSIFSSLMTGLVLWVVLLITNASKLSNASGSATGSLGPIKLFQLSKTALTGGGSSAGINFLGRGCLIYFSIFIFIGGIIGFLRSRKD